MADQPPETPESPPDNAAPESRPAAGPLTNYTLSSVCPACDVLTYRLACKVRCPRCGFVWDCSEL